MLTPSQQAIAADNYGLAVVIARGYTADDEAVGVALLSLCRAAALWNPAYVVPLKVFLACRIRRDVKVFLAKHTHPTLHPSEYERYIAAPLEVTTELPVPERLLDVAQLHFVDGLSLTNVARTLHCSRRKVTRLAKEVRAFLNRNHPAAARSPAPNSVEPTNEI